MIVYGSMSMGLEYADPNGMFMSFNLAKYAIFTSLRLSSLYSSSNLTVT